MDYSHSNPLYDSETYGILSDISIAEAVEHLKLELDHLAHRAERGDQAALAMLRGRDMELFERLQAELEYRIRPAVARRAK